MPHFLWVFFFVYGNKSSSVAKARSVVARVEPHPLLFSLPLGNLKTLHQEKDKRVLYIYERGGDKDGYH